MQNGTLHARNDKETGRALVPVPLPAPAEQREDAPALFSGQLIDPRLHPSRLRLAGSDQALRRYSAADALATAKTRGFERVV